jgi:hypothetical protein
MQAEQTRRALRGISYWLTQQRKHLHCIFYAVAIYLTIK